MSTQTLAPTVTLKRLREFEQIIKKLLPLAHNGQQEAVTAICSWHSQMLSLAHSKDQALRKFAFDQLETLEDHGLISSTLFADRIINSGDLEISRETVSLIESFRFLTIVQSRFPIIDDPKSLVKFLDVFLDKILDLSSQLDTKSDVKSVYYSFTLLSRCYDFSIITCRTDYSSLSKTQLLRLFSFDAAVEAIKNFLESCGASLINNRAYTQSVAKELIMPTIDLVLEQISQRKMVACVPCLADFRIALQEGGVTGYLGRVSSTLSALGYIDTGLDTTN